MSAEKRLNMLVIKLEKLKIDLVSKKRFTVEEKQRMKNAVIYISEELGDMMADDMLGIEFKERINTDSRKQVYLIKKAVYDLDRLVNVSRSIVC